VHGLSFCALNFSKGGNPPSFMGGGDVSPFLPPYKPPLSKCIKFYNSSNKWENIRRRRLKASKYPFLLTLAHINAVNFAQLFVAWFAQKVNVYLKHDMIKQIDQYCFSTESMFYLNLHFKKSVPLKALSDQVWLKTMFLFL